MSEWTMRKQIETVLLAEITKLNGETTEEALNMVIMESILEERLKEVKVNREALIQERLDSEIDNENTETNGVYVYNADSLESLIFDKYDTIADAVRAAIKMINATILCDGNIVNYDTIDNSTAYYIDERVNKVKIVNL